MGRIASVLDGFVNGERATVRRRRRLAVSAYGLLLVGLLTLGTAVAAPGDTTDDDDDDNRAPRVVERIENQVIEEDRPFSLDISGNFEDPDGDPLLFVGNDLPGSLSLSQDGVISGTPTQNDIGRYQVRIVAIDPSAEFAVDRFRIDIVGVNDPPVIVRQRENPLQSREDEVLRVTISDLEIADPDSPLNAIRLRLEPGANYTLLSDDQLRPAANYNGSLTVPVVASDGLADSNRFLLNVRITAVNDAPVITGQTAVNINEDTNVRFNLGLLTVADPDDVYPDDFVFTLAAGANYTLSGDLIRPRANFNGTLTVGVTVNDGTADSASFPFKINVREINDPPVITGQRPIRIDDCLLYTSDAADDLQPV